MQGRFGNQLFQYAHGRAWAEQNGHQLITAPWVGEKIFQIEPTWRLLPDKCDHVLSGYFQHQKDIIWTRKQAREWFTLKYPYSIRMTPTLYKSDEILAHRRVGDYGGSGFVVVSEKSYVDTVKKFGYDWPDVQFITEENPTFWPGYGDEVSFLPDFIRMMRAKVLFRGNSTFSFWASLLGTAKTYSPVIKGLCGGMEQDCDFVEGNWPQMVDLDFTSDLHIPEQ